MRDRGRSTVEQRARKGSFDDAVVSPQAFFAESVFLFFLFLIHTEHDARGGQKTNRNKSRNNRRKTPSCCKLKQRRGQEKKKALTFFFFFFSCLHQYLRCCCCGFCFASGFARLRRVAPRRCCSAWRSKKRFRCCTDRKVLTWVKRLQILDLAFRASKWKTVLKEWRTEWRM